MEEGKGRFVGTEDALTEKIIRIFCQVYNELEFGFSGVGSLSGDGIALMQAGLAVASEVGVPVSFRRELVGTFRADLVVERRVILELKTADAISKAHEAQLTHYLRASMLEVGLILNFGSAPKFRRVQFLNERKCPVAISIPISPFSF